MMYNALFGVSPDSPETCGRSGIQIVDRLCPEEAFPLLCLFVEIMAS